MRPPFRQAVYLLFPAGLVGLAVWLSQTPRPPDPPRPPTDVVVDPTVKDLLQDTYTLAKQSPSDADARARLGMVYQANLLPESAAACYRQAASIEPDRARWWYYLALVREELGDVDEALETIDHAIELDDDYAPSHWRRGLWLLEKGEADAAIESFRRSIERDSRDPNGRLGLARAHLQNGDAAAAAGVLERVITDHPENAYAHLLLGTAYRRLGRADDARAALTRGRGAEPHWTDPWYEEVMRLRSGFPAAIEQARRALQNGDPQTMIALLEPWRVRKPNDVALLNNLGTAYLAAGRFEQAFEVLSASAKANPNHFATYLNLATACYRTGDPNHALVHANRAIELNPTLGRAYETKGQILWGMQRYEAALDAFQKAFQLDARRPIVLVWAGQMQCELKRWSDAVETYERVLAIDPRAADAHLGLATATMELGEFERAAAALNRAESLNPQDPHIAAAADRLRRLHAARASPPTANDRSLECHTPSPPQPETPRG